MLCMLITLLCCVMVCGKQTFDWDSAISNVYDDWSELDTNQDIPGMMALVSDDVTFNPPGAPPIRGKQAVTESYEAMLENGLWPQQKMVKFEKVIAECRNVAVAEHSTDIVFSDGKIYHGSGVCVFTKDKRRIEILACSWNSDGPLIDPKDI